MHSAMLLGIGKPPGRSLMATTVPGQSPSYLFFVLECTSHQHFLVDTGAEISVVPPSKSERQHKQQCINLLAANGATITTYGLCSITLNLGFCHPYHWIFTVAVVRQPILGADFLRHHGLLVDVKNRILMDSESKLKTDIISTHQNTHSLTTLNPLFSSNPFHSLLLDYLELTCSFIDNWSSHFSTYSSTPSGTSHSR
uniref:Peptidase A2 domain-containing protein n=1 Tax=Amphimedon queenslandica TaxID=400682 RepID=A0A1X7UEZ2_AMPQE